jgi:hypothetical protein
MAKQIESYGFEDLRNYAQSNWAFIALIASDGSEILRWDANNNSNVTWSSGPGTNPLTAEITVKGQDIIDAGGSLPVTISETETYKSASASTRIGNDTMSDATLEVAEDQVTISHNYNLPPN